MFEKLDGILERYDEIMEQLNDPNVVSDQSNFRKLMKEQSDLAPIVELYRKYKEAQETIQDSLAILDEESDEEMRELAKEEMNEAKASIPEMEEQLKILLLPKDENDDKNVVVEIRGGAGGDEAALFAAELYRMYCMYAETQKWKTELISVNENGLGGFKEVVFTGINLSCYDDNGKKLIDVIELAENTEGIERIRLGSLDPEVVTEEFAHRLSKVTKICPHFHLSMQSGCDTTLKAMNRHYTSEEYYNKCMLLREKFINPAFTTDVIVGFPQESDEDYATTREFVKKVGFSELHVFKYSRRDGTVAAKMIGQVDETIKSKRSEDLISVGESLKENYRKEKIGEKVSVLFEEEKEINGIKYQVGHTKEYIEVAVETKENLAGKIEEVFLKDFIDNEIMLATRKVLY